MSAVFWLFAAGYAAALKAASCGGTAVRFLESGWLLTTGLLALASLAVVYGCLPWPGAILRTADREVAAAGARLGGLLQYPNTFGAVMGAALLERLTALAALPRQAFTRAGRWQGQQAGALAPVFALCLLLTESRGAFAALAAAWAIAALLLRRGERLRFALHSAAALGAGALLAAPLMRAGLAPPALQGLGALAAVLGGWAAATAALAAAGPRALRLITGKRCAAGVAALAAAAGLLALAAAWPGALLALPQRLTGAATLLARGDMYADALRVIGGAPWLGQGGDTWRSVYRSVQSSPYTGSEVHSGYLDLLMDLGLAGVLVLLAWIIPALRSAFQNRCRLLPSVLLLLLHSLIDFDLSYGLVWLLLIWLFRWAKAEAAAADGKVPLSLPAKLAPPSEPLFPRWLVLLAYCRSIRFFRVLLPGTAALALLCAAVLCLGQAESLRRERLALAVEAQYPQEAEKLLRQASTLAPARHRLYLALAARSDAEEATVWLQRGLSYERARPELELALGKLLAEREDLAALEHLRRATELNRYSNMTWVTAMSEASRLAAMKMADREAERELQQQAAWQTLAAGAEFYARYTELTAGGPWRRNDLNFGGEETVIRLGEQLRSMRESLPALRMNPVSESSCQPDPY